VQGKRTVVAVRHGGPGAAPAHGPRSAARRAVAVARELLHCEGHEFHVKAWCVKGGGRRDVKDPGGGP